MTQVTKNSHLAFEMNCDTFDKLLEHNNIRWFDIVLYNYIKDKAEFYGAYDETYQEYDRETKTTSHFKDKYGLVITDLQLSRILRVKGNEDTAKKEISRSLKRLETAGVLKREYAKTESKALKETRFLIPLI